METLRLCDLRLGDVVECFEGPFGTATVNNISGEGDNKIVHFYRPYVHNESWSYTGGTICAVGIEEFTRFINDRETIKVWKRGDVK